MDEATTDVLIVDDHPILGEGLALVLRYEGVAAKALVPRSPDEVFDVLRSCGAKVVLLDLDLGWTHQDGLDLIAPLLAEEVVIVVFSATRDRRQLALALEAGAAGAVTKGQSFDDLVDAIMRARIGEPVNYEPERVALADELQRYRARQREQLAPFEWLTAREASVLQGLMDGYSAETIARQSFVALTTVRSQIRAVLSKLGVCSQLGAVALARHAQWSAHPESNDPVPK
jgi:DNA-binding NarL/FixJ family response regulator